MDDTPVFQVKLNEKAYSRLKRIADKIPTSPEQMFMFLALFLLKDVESGVHHINWYKKRFLKLEEDLKL